MNQREVRDLKNVVSLLRGFENIRVGNPVHAPFPSSVYEVLAALIDRYETKEPKMPRPRKVSFMAGAKGGEVSSPDTVRLTLARPEAEALRDHLAKYATLAVQTVYQQLVAKVGRRG